MNRWQFGILLFVLTAAVLGLGLAVALAESSPAATVRYVALTGNDAGNACATPVTPCRTIQRAVDQARAGDEIRIAVGAYTGVAARAGVTQTVYISKTLTLRGGFTTSNWTTPDPLVNRTTLDAEGRGRVLYIVGSIEANVLKQNAFPLRDRQDMQVKLEGLRITGGNATNQGGGVAGRDAGGGVYGFLATVQIDQCEIVGNVARTAAGCCGEGGGVYLFMSALPMIENNRLVDNTAGMTAAGRGGGVYLEQALYPIVAANVFSGNVGSAQQDGLGGGLYVRNSDDAVVGQNFFWNNIASAIAGGDGGGLYLTSSHGSRVIANDFLANSGAGGDGRGGGLYASDSRHVALDANTMIGNKATAGPNAEGWGGGAYIVSCGPYTLTNNAITDNYATTAGSGLWLGGEAANAGAQVSGRKDAALRASGWLLHNTFVSNVPGDGSGVFVTGAAGRAGSIEMVNSIVATQTVGVLVADGSHANLTATLWYDNLLDWGGVEGSVTQALDYHGDPKFESLAGSAVARLTLRSPAIDKGVNAGVGYDREGKARPFGRGYDLGADEYPLRLLYLPAVWRRR